MSATPLEAAARAKVNLSLRIFPPRPDGFHPLETLFCRISLADRVRVTVRERPGVTLELQGAESAPAGRENLAVRAAALLLQRANSSSGVEIGLEKQVPAGAGLGGGSSDAAAVLRLLNRALGEPLAEHALFQMAAELGSDVTFFLADRPLAWAWGRGDRLLALPAPEPRPLLLVVPDRRIATAESYALWDQRAKDARPRRAASVRGWEETVEWDAVIESAVNDFEPVVLGRYPWLAELAARVDGTGPRLRLLAGSGSGLFGIYDDEAQRDAAAEDLAALADVRTISASGPA